MATQRSSPVPAAAGGAESAPETSPVARSSPLLDLLWTTPFIAIFLIQLVHHDMWRDELNAFGIAIASPTL
jgi:hypothetical protein